MFSRKYILLTVCLFPALVFGQDILNKPYSRYSFSCGKPAGKIILSTSSDPKSFNPIVAQEVSTTEVTGLIFEGLVRADPRTLEIKPNLAKRWEVKHGGKEWLFYLRQDVFFNDGVKFTADDVIFTFNELIYNEDIPTSSRDIFYVNGRKISVEKVDDYTVRFILPSSFGPFLRAMSQDILPQHKYLRAVKEKKFTFAMGLDCPLKDIVGTGPFKLKQYLPGERIVLEANPYYWKKDSCVQRLPYLRQVVFLIMPGQDTALLRFIDGETDYYALRPQDLAVLGPLAEKKGFTIYNGGISFGVNFVVFNQTLTGYKSEWFRRGDFRRAIAYALNRSKMVEILFNGLGAAQDSPVEKGNGFFYNPKLIQYDYNPGKARELLLSCGFIPGPDGILQDKNGRRLEIDFYTNANDQLRVQMGSLVKHDLEDIGFKINFLPLDFNNLVGKINSASGWEMVLIGLTGGIEPHFAKNVWSYKGALHLWNRSGRPLAAYEEEIETIFNRAAMSTDDEMRKRLYNRWQEIAVQEVPLIFTAGQYSLYAVRNKFNNMFPTVYGGAFGEIEYLYPKE